MTTMIFCDKCDEVITKELKGKTIARFYDMVEVIGNHGSYVGKETHPRRTFHLCNPCTVETLKFIEKRVNA